MHRRRNRGVTTVEWVIVAMIVGVGMIAAWKAFKDRYMQPTVENMGDCIASAAGDGDLCGGPGGGGQQGGGGAQAAGGVGTAGAGVAGGGAGEQGGAGAVTGANGVGGNGAAGGSNGAAGGNGAGANGGNGAGANGGNGAGGMTAGELANSVGARPGEGGGNAVAANGVGSGAGANGVGSGAGANGVGSGAGANGVGSGAGANGVAANGDNGAAAVTVAHGGPGAGEGGANGGDGAGASGGNGAAANGGNAAAANGGTGGAEGGAHGEGGESSKGEIATWIGWGFALEQAGEDALIQALGVELPKWAEYTVGGIRTATGAAVAVPLDIGSNGWPHSPADWASLGLKTTIAGALGFVGGLVAGPAGATAPVWVDRSLGYLADSITGSNRYQADYDKAWLATIIRNGPYGPTPEMMQRAEANRQALVHDQLQYMRDQQARDDAALREMMYGPAGAPASSTGGGGTATQTQMIGR